LCHVNDDVHSGSFGTDCGSCHGQLAWLPSSFTHVDTGYVLEGIHRTLECRECHGAGNYFIGKKCYSCHLRDYREAEWHRGLEVAAQAGSPKVFIGDWARSGGKYDTIDCGECHNQFTFLKATYGTSAKERKK
jgi:DnaJ-class molecular chaperone